MILFLGGDDIYVDICLVDRKKMQMIDNSTILNKDWRSVQKAKKGC